MRVRVEIYEPVELSLDLPESEVAAVFGEIDATDISPDSAEIRAAPGARLSGVDIGRLVVGPRHAGDSLRALLDGQSRAVMGSARPLNNSKPINFIGKVFPLQD